MSSRPLRYLAAWFFGILAVGLVSAVAGTPPTVSAAQSECYSGATVKAVTASPSKTRAGGGSVTVELIVENEERSDRQISRRVTIEDPNGAEAIAEERGLSERTISNQLSTGCHKLGFGDRRELKGWGAAVSGFVLTQRDESQVNSKPE